MKSCTWFLAALSLTAIQYAAEQPLTPETLRKNALAVIQPLPQQMPGAEKDSPTLVALGKKLFFENKLSANQNQSCNSCHSVEQGRGGVDNEKTSPGAFGKRGGRNSPTVLNAGLHFAQFWDGRAESLEAQAKGPILNPIEMAMPNEPEVLKRLQGSSEYVDGFRKAFPKEKSPITYDNVANAIAAFERTLLTHDRVDDFLSGNDQALSAAELGGLQNFLTLGCTTCHHGPLLGGNSFQKIGLVNAYEDAEDVGRYSVTKDLDDKFKFKVPSLRNIALTAPYFHNGRVATLEDAVSSMAWLQLGRELSSNEKSSLVLFLRALSDKDRSKGRSH